MMPLTLCRQDVQMQYVIIGAGAVGGTIGGRLHQHGCRITLVARGEQLAAIREHGLLLATPDGEDRLDVPVVAGPAGLLLEPDCVLVLAVKSQDTVATLAGWADVAVRGGGCAGQRLPVVCAQNGVANEPAALRLFARVYGACVWLPATFLEPGLVLAQGHPNSGMLHLGRYPGGVDDTARRIAADLSAAALVARTKADVMRFKHGKLLGNLGNGLGALFDTPDQELLDRVRAEGRSVLDAAGRPYTSRPEEIAERGELVQLRPVAGRPRGGSSTWQSLARGTGTVEVDYLNGEIVLLGRSHGVPAPVNLAVQQAVRRAVRDKLAPGQFPVDEFRALLRSAGG
jgi:2-dehydropantoate 2-reductase